MTDPVDRRERYARSSRPKAMRLLRACRLDRIYHRAEGDWLDTRAEDGREVRVLDAVGGFGVGVLGHHHPAIVAAFEGALRARRPFHAQGSNRAPAGDLCWRLSELAGAHTGRRYVVTLANSGTEAVEAAIKHAELERRAKVEALIKGCRSSHSAIQEKLRNRECDVVPRLLDQAELRLGLLEGSQPDLEEIFHHVLAHNMRLADERPLFLALQGAFHGKTCGSVQLTHDPEYRLPFRHLGIDVRFLPRGDVAALEDAVRDATVTYFDLAIDRAGAVGIRERPFVNIGALFVEPIQGEGGVRPLGAEFLQTAARVARRHGFPLVLDEIQTGCGRTGTFLASEQDEVIGDYYLLSKALGGGLAKAAALLVDSARYQDDFGYVHSSTFADDDLTSVVALAALDVLADAEFLAGVQLRGARLRAALEQVQARHPGVIREVRGRGMMIGVELASRVDATSPTIRVLSEQELLGFALAGYLLNEHRVRVLPTLSQPNTLRIQLSGLAGDAEREHLVGALERMCRILEADRSDLLVGYLCRAGEWPAPADDAEAGEAAGPVARVAPARPARRERVPPFAGRVAFLGHFIRAGHLGLWDPALAELEDPALEAYLERVHRVLDPFVSETVNVTSITGERVQLNAIGVPVTPRLIERGFEEGSVRWVEDEILEGIRLARRSGASIVGLGGYLSILTGQGTRLSEDRVGITSGNAMTVAMGVEALLETARELEIDLDAACLGALGGTGNICSLYAQLAADAVSRIVLIGRSGMDARLRVVAQEVYFEVYKSIRRAGGRPLAGLARLLAGTDTFRRVAAAEGSVERIGAAIYDGLAEEMGAEVPIRIEGDPSALTACDLIVAASSAAGPVIFPEHLGPGPGVICDLAVPEDTSPRVFAERPDVRVIRGGIVRLPADPDLVLPGLPLDPGCVYACLAETLLLGLSRINEHFSWGRVTRAHVEAIRDLARYHGFTLTRPAMTAPL